MAVSAAAVHKSPGRFDTSWDVTATADADTGTTITHGIPNISDANDELKVTFEPLLQAPAALSAWAVTARSKTTVTIAKGERPAQATPGALASADSRPPGGGDGPTDA